MSPHPIRRVPIRRVLTRRVFSRRCTALLAVPALLIAAFVAFLPGAAAEASGGGQPAATSAHHPKPPRPTPPPRPAAFVVKGAVAHPLRLTVADLAKYPQHTQQVSFVSGSGTQTHTYTGPRLVDVIQAAGPKFRPEVKNDLLRYAVLIRASDGYESVLSWPEITEGFGGVQALIAATEDGVSLAADGPRLTVPSDTKGGRYVSWITSITLVRVGS
ncbi:hypothetical protein CC117_21985 [Parafrankia colletiae]|uniref:Oxidoreductase molybdopterin-binding domain-containing protein n=1 Tax=Parafrankia colletiae TaxID=573497 RepID=A0A1S1QM08_9ACTN|nr:molybdopterin-dependent oxidoreductase [Parafrankia colletiae]MCK9899943.1 molybdopterin-dependent oxidoreductase [Frankia sp. Cpl3]OHV34295.1 hypothetical protein CC117_21985 [Parafrankia colletiae]